MLIIQITPIWKSKQPDTTILTKDKIKKQREITMSKENTICLMNDSFPPLIDGVANAVTNYAAF